MHADRTHTCGQLRASDAGTAAGGVSLTTLRLSFVRVAHRSRRVSGYAGVGAGTYCCAYANMPLPPRWLGGIHGLLGMDWLRGSGRTAIGGQLRLTVVETTGTPYWWSTTTLDATVGWKLRF